MGYEIQWDGNAVTLPAEVGSDATGVSFKYLHHDLDESVLRMNKFVTSMFDSARRDQTRISVPVVIVPEPDDDDGWSVVSVALPKSMVSTWDARHLGFLYERYISRLGDGALDRLAELSDGEIHCTAILTRDLDEGYYKLDFDDPDDLKYAPVEIRLSLPRAHELANAIERFCTANDVDHDAEGRERTDHVLARLSFFEAPEIPVGPLSLETQAGWVGEAGSLAILSGDTLIGHVALGYLFLKDERHRGSVLDGLSKLDVPAAQPRAYADIEWALANPPNITADWRAGGLKFRWVEQSGQSKQTFARYNPTTKKLWVEDERLVDPARVYAARLGLDVTDVGLPPRRWTLGETVWRGYLRDLDYDRTPTDIVQPLNPRLFTNVPLGAISGLEGLGRLPGITGEDKESTILLEKFSAHRSTLFHDSTSIAAVGTCRICERPAGEFRAPICTEMLAYCHRCLAAAAKGLSVTERTLPEAFTRATAAVRALALAEFGGSAFVEAQLDVVHGVPEHPMSAPDIDARILQRIAIPRGRLPWTHILIDAGLADSGIRRSRGTVLKAVDGHLCSSMLEKAVDDFLHQNGIGHTREPLYPSDEQFNPNTLRRADWLLSDGTFVEMWGMPKDPAYAKKMGEKMKLVVRHRLQFIGLVPEDVGRLNEIFARSLRSIGS
ncbi:MAG: hypothetical protein WBA98_02355 [Gordonia sp. (in: high G+C Gram-positive bacteria)]|uniref:hypothetical protein n=1 Tax=Gordonia sp. (in: high G+C Gram-positive bacteria) TaxID=84139 RepID=UPI003C760D2E